jgi:hypothetical protein
MAWFQDSAHRGGRFPSNFLASDRVGITAVFSTALFGQRASGIQRQRTVLIRAGVFRIFASGYCVNRFPPMLFSGRIILIGMRLGFLKIFPRQRG